MKATEEVTSLTPVMEAKLEAIVDRVIAEILERFPNGVKIYEIQNVVEHELLKPTNMRLLRATLLIGLSGILSAQKRRISTLRLENSSTRTKRLSMKMPIRDSDVFNTQRDLTAGIVGKSIGLKMLPKHVANAHQKGISTTMIWTIALIHR